MIKKPSHGVGLTKEKANALLALLKLVSEGLENASGTSSEAGKSMASDRFKTPDANFMSRSVGSSAPVGLRRKSQAMGNGSCQNRLW